MVSGNLYCLGLSHLQPKPKGLALQAATRCRTSRELGKHPGAGGGSFLRSEREPGEADNRTSRV